MNDDLNKAADWFSSLTYLQQHALSDKYFESRNPSLLTIEQVAHVYKSEQAVAKQIVEYACTIYNMHYGTDKSFREVAESLIRSFSSVG